MGNQFSVDLNLGIKNGHETSLILNKSAIEKLSTNNSVTPQEHKNPRKYVCFIFSMLLEAMPLMLFKERRGKAGPQNFIFSLFLIKCNFNQIFILL